MFKIRYFVNFLKILGLSIIIYNEVLTYLVLPYQWASQLECASSTCVKILLIADPQILGEQDSSKLAQWDSDRYLQKTFSYALNYVQPDVIIFLGDEMDEGHISSDAQFRSNLRRFRAIFHIPQDSPALTIYIPGDNDIGGEGDPILPHVVHRFDKVFQESIDPVTFQNLEFYKVNKMTLMFQEPEAISDGTIRIALTHMPILRKIHTFSKQIASSIQPHIIFSGHDHNSVHVSAPLDDVWQKTIEDIGPSSGWLHYALGGNVIHEVIIPTCSYRMGALNMGYGLAIVDQTANTLSYSVLWLPPRLPHLSVYLGFLIFVAVFGVCCGLITLNRRVQRLCRSVYAKSFTARYQHIP